MKKCINLKAIFLSSLVQCLPFQAQLQFTAVLKIQQMLQLNSSENRSVRMKPQKNLLTTSQWHHFVKKYWCTVLIVFYMLNKKENYDKRPWASRFSSCCFIFSAKNTGSLLLYHRQENTSMIFQNNIIIVKIFFQ